MRLKGINPIEQHFEKVIAGVFALGLLGVVALQFVGAPNSVKVGGKDVAIDRAYPEIGTEAKRVLGRLEAVGIEKPASGDVGTESLRAFQSSFKGPVASGNELAAALDRSQPSIAMGGSDATKPGTAFAELKLPTAGIPLAATHLSTIDASEAADPAVAAILPREQPFDLAGVSVETTIDGTMIKGALTNDPDGDGPIQPMPERWWKTLGVQIIGVELERETLQGDGSWSNLEAVKAMPGRIVMPGTLAEITTALQLKDAMKIATDRAAMVRTPPYYAERFGEKWTPPTERKVEVGAAGLDDRGQVTNEIDRLQKRLKSLEDALAKVGQPGGGRSPPPPPPGAGGGRGGGGGKGAGGGGGGGRGGGGAGSPPPGNDKADEVRRNSIQRQIDQVQKQLIEAQDRLAEMEGRPKSTDTLTTQPTDNADPRRGASGLAEAGLLENASVRLWAHDVFVERGKTYRYRVSVALNNPYFGHSAAMLPEQASFAAGAVIKTPASEWSEPVSVEAPNYFFVTSATEDDRVTRGSSARAEVYEFKWGYWRRGAVQLEPGDTLNVEIKYPDMTQVAAMPNPDAPPTMPPGGGRDGGGRTPGGGKGAGGGGAANPGGGAARPPAGGGGGGDGSDKSQEPPPMKTIEVSRETLMLGVSAWAHADPETGKTSATQRVLFREGPNRVVVRVPLEERDSATYRRISRNAELGVKNLEPNKGTKQDIRRPDQPPNPGGDRDPGPGGGGGMTGG